MADDSGREDRQFERYLLGLLPDDETERLDELSITDDEAAWRLNAAENDLVDTYVRGELSGETLQRFESYYLASPVRRAKVTFAQTLLVDANAAGATSPAVTPATPFTAAAGAAGAPGAAPRAGERWIDRLFPSKTAPWSVLVAIAALLLVVCGVLIVQDLRMRQAVMRAEMDRAALEQRTQELQQQLEAQRAANANAAAELARIRASGGTVTGQPPVAGGSQRAGPTAGSSSSSSSTPTTIALMLWPRTRSGGANATLAVPPGTDRVAIDLRIEANDFAHYDAVLKDLATNRVVWRSGRLAAKAGGDHTSVIAIVPADVLTPRRYALDLTGHHANGTAELISSYPFQVLGR